MRNAISTLAHAGRSTIDAARRHLAVTGVTAALLMGSLGAGAAFAFSRPAAATAPSSASVAASDLAFPLAANGKAHRAAFAFRALVRLVAKDTNQTREAVIAQLKAGKSLDQIAGSKAAAIQQEVLDRLQTRLNDAVKAGKITKDQAAQRLATWKTRLATIMSTPGTSLPFKPLRPGKPAATSA